MTANISILDISSSTVEYLSWSLGPITDLDIIGRVANQIRIFRERAGLSQEALGSLVGTSKLQISRLERGERRFTDDWMRRLAKALNCSPADLLPEEDSGLSERESAILGLVEGLTAEQQDLIIQALSPLVQSLKGRP